LFAGETDLNSLQLKLYARDLGLDTEQFGACLDTGRYERTIERNLEAAKKAGVNSTPTFVVNGVPVIGPLEVARFKDLIDFELGRQTDKLARDSRSRAGSNLTN
jgi:protein-disulfide isomerase